MNSETIYIRQAFEMRQINLTNATWMLLTNLVQ